MQRLPLFFTLKAKHRHIFESLNMSFTLKKPGCTSALITSRANWNMIAEIIVLRFNPGVSPLLCSWLMQSKFDRLQVNLIWKNTWMFLTTAKKKMEIQQKNLNMFFPCYLTPYSQRLPDVISTLKVCKGKTLRRLMWNNTRTCLIQHDEYHKVKTKGIRKQKSCVHTRFFFAEYINRCFSH